MSTVSNPIQNRRVNRRELSDELPIMARIEPKHRGAPQAQTSARHAIVSGAIRRRHRVAALAAVVRDRDAPPAVDVQPSLPVAVCGVVRPSENEGAVRRAVSASVVPCRSAVEPVWLGTRPLNDDDDTL